MLALVGVAQFFASHEPFAETRASQIWGAIHGVFILLGTVAVMVGFVAGVMYLLQSYRLKHKQLPPQGFRLPNLEWLDHVNSRAIVISALMLAAGFLSGTVLNLVNHRLEVDELPWSDPVIWTSSLLLAWLATAAIFGVVYQAGPAGAQGGVPHRGQLCVPGAGAGAAAVFAQRTFARARKHTASASATTAPDTVSRRGIAATLLIADRGDVRAIDR